jgi:hypothetical protein
MAEWRAALGHDLHRLGPQSAHGRNRSSFYSVDSNETIIDKLISERLTTENYEFTGLINVKTGKIVFHDPLPKDGTAPHFEEVFDHRYRPGGSRVPL